MKVGTPLGFRRRIAHSGLHGETGGVSDGGGITTLGAFRTFTNLSLIHIWTTADVLNIRKGPGTNYGVAGQIKGKGCLLYTSRCV